jgi:DNA-directed RNA polymerase specialized sigma24 family protein
MSGAGNASDHARPREPLAPIEATRLWATYCAGASPLAIIALDDLYRALRKPLVEFCRLKGCDGELADEVSEQAWVRLLVRKPPARRGFIALLRKTAQNLALKALRERTSGSVQALPIRVARDPPEPAEQSETIQAVRDCLSHLASADRAFLLLVDVHGLTRAAACELLGWDLAPSTSHERHLRIRQELSDCLKSKKIL